MTFLVDTNVISELVKRRPNSGVVAWAQTTSHISVSAVTVEEVFFGLAWKPNPRIQSWFERFLDEGCDIYPVTADIAKCCGLLRGHFAATGRQRTQADLLIASTAQIERLTVVTRNVRDFEDCGIALLDPFAKAP
jgi:predicted nucleic acid-binding protein